MTRSYRIQQKGGPGHATLIVGPAIYQPSLIVATIVHFDEGDPKLSPFFSSTQDAEDAKKAAEAWVRRALFADFDITPKREWDESA